MTVPYSWIVEYFPASDIDRLYASIRKFGWDGPRFGAADPGGTESVMSGRQGRGRVWWRMAELRSLRSQGYLSVDGQRVRLPRDIDAIDLVAVPIGKGLTAVVASFRLSDLVSARFNEVLDTPHRHEVLRRKGRMAVSQPPPAVLHHRTQRERDRVHRHLRRWMRKHLPGAFARYRKSHPLYDVIFFNEADPFSGDTGRLHRENDALRAMGLHVDFVYQVTSQELPGLILDQHGSGDWAPGISENIWTFWGNKNAAAGLTAGTGNSGVEAAGYYVGSRATDFLVRRGLTAFLRAMREDASSAHDNARKLHGGTRSRDLRRLRNRTLTTSLDLATLEADIKEYNGRRWRDREPQFYLEITPSARQWWEEGGEPFKPIDVNQDDRKTQRKLASELVAFDARYREVLSTVASLGTSLDSRRVQRLAFYVSIVSLAVAVVTLFVTQEPQPGIVSDTCDAITALGWTIC